MKLEDAIVYLSDCMRETERVLYPEILKAHMLGIKALEAFSDYRKGLVVDFELPLPGETEE